MKYLKKFESWIYESVEESQDVLLSEMISKMYDYQKLQETDPFLDQYDVENGEVKNGLHRSHAEGIKQVRRFLNGLIEGLSGIVKEYKSKSNSEEGLNSLEKLAFEIYYSLAEKVGEGHAMSELEAFSKFQKYLEREYIYV